MLEIITKIVKNKLEEKIKDIKRVQISLFIN